MHSYSQDVFHCSLIYLPMYSFIPATLNASFHKRNFVNRYHTQAISLKNNIKKKPPQ